MLKETAWLAASWRDARLVDIIPSSISALQWPHEGKPKKTIENSKNVYVHMYVYIYI